MAKLNTPLSLSVIAKLACPDGKTREYYRCPSTPGLGVRVSHTGRKDFIFEAYANGASLRITIGDVRSWNLPQAQAKAREFMVLLDQGKDPRLLKQEQVLQTKEKLQRSSPSLTLWQEYLEARRPIWSKCHYDDHMSVSQTGGSLITRGRRPGQSAITQVGLLFPLLQLPLQAITRDVMKVWIEEHRGPRATRTRLALTHLKTFLKWCKVEGYAKDLDLSVCDGLKKNLPSPGAKTECLEPKQLKPWFTEVLNIENQTIACYLQVLLLTGARPTEIRKIRWDDLDLQWSTVTIRDKVEGTRQIPLTAYVQYLIESLPKKSDYVFASSTRPDSYLVDPRASYYPALSRAKIASMPLHALRRSFGTLADGVDCPEGIRAQLMGHKPSAIAEKHYRKRSIDTLREWHQKIETFILGEAGVSIPKLKISKKKPRRLK